MTTSRFPVASTASRAHAVAALTAAGVAWGMSVPLSKAALSWLPPAWLAAARFAVAAAVLLAVADRAALRAARRWQILAWGAVGFGGAILAQNAGIARTSVAHAALLIGASPVLVAVITAAWRHTVARPVAWAGFAVSLGGVALVASGHDGGATGLGDALVLASVLVIATMTVAQARLLEEQDPVAVTAVQFLGAALTALAVAACTAGAPPAPPAGGAGALAALAVAGLALGATLVPFTLFAYGQRQVPAEVAGAFMNLEPFVGSLLGVAAFGDPAGPRLLIGGAAVLGGTVMSSLPALLLLRRVAGPRGGQTHPPGDLPAAPGGQPQARRQRRYGPPHRRPQAKYGNRTAAANASTTAWPSRTVVPAMSRNRTQKRLNGMSPRRSRERGSLGRDRRGRPRGQRHRGRPRAAPPDREAAAEPLAALLVKHGLAGRRRRGT